MASPAQAPVRGGTGDVEATVVAHAYRVAVDERLRELVAWRRWYRARPWTLDWPSRAASDQELRSLVRIARQARRAARPVIARQDPIDIATAYVGWSEGELAEAFGR